MRTLNLTLAFLFLGAVALAQNRVNYGSLSWSKDGRQILFSSIEVLPDWSNYSPFNWRLYLYDLKQDKLELIDRSAMFGAFSPDGSQVVYSKNTGASWDLFIKNLDTGKKTKVTDTPQRESAPDWSPDGRMIVFTKDLKKGVSAIYSMDPSGRNVRNLSQNGQFECHNPEFSPDGDRIIYYMDRGDKKDQVYVMEIWSGFSRNVTQDRNHNFHPAWFDNQALLFTRGNDQLCIKELDGGPTIPVEGIQSFFARYNARSKQAAYISKEDQSIYVQKMKGKPGRLKLGNAARIITPELIRGR
ncbi:MAG: PD40 domain-containing protein [Phaeodactylibacter sp.]|nr:PD40 domain-containing protein [Phaeodactylibacter sp.]